MSSNYRGYYKKDFETQDENGDTSRNWSRDNMPRDNMPRDNMSNGYNNRQQNGINKRVNYINCLHCGGKNTKLYIPYCSQECINENKCKTIGCENTGYIMPYNGQYHKQLYCGPCNKKRKQRQMEHQQNYNSEEYSNEHSNEHSNEYQPEAENYQEHDLESEKPSTTTEIKNTESVPTETPSVDKTESATTTDDKSQQSGKKTKKNKRIATSDSEIPIGSGTVSQSNTDSTINENSTALMASETIHGTINEVATVQSTIKQEEPIAIVQFHDSGPASKSNTPDILVEVIKKETIVNSASYTMNPTGDIHRHNSQPNIVSEGKTEINQQDIQSATANVNVNVNANENATDDDFIVYNEHIRLLNLLTGQKQDEIRQAKTYAEKQKAKYDMMKNKCRALEAKYQTLEATIKSLEIMARTRADENGFPFFNLHDFVKNFNKNITPPPLPPPNSAPSTQPPLHPIPQSLSQTHLHQHSQPQPQMYYVVHPGYHPGVSMSPSQNYAVLHNSQGNIPFQMTYPLTQPPNQQLSNPQQPPPNQLSGQLTPQSTGQLTPQPTQQTVDVPPAPNNQ